VKFLTSMGLTGLALLAGCSGEYEEREVDVGLTGEARTNPLLMAHMWSEAMGLESSTTTKWPRDIADQSIIVAAASEWTGPSSETDEVLAWVDSGGHLMMCVFGYEEFESTFWLSEDLDEDKTKAMAGILGRQPILAELGVELGAEIIDNNEIEIDGEDLNVYFPEVPGLIDTRGEALDLVIEDSDGANLLQFEYGDGLVTLLSSGALLTNERFAMGTRNHAEFFWHLVDGELDIESITFVVGKNPTLWSMLVDHFSAAMLAGLALLLLYLWRAWKRFGPMLQEPLPVHRAFHEHVEATGRFLWRRKQSASLLGAFRSLVIRRAERTLPFAATQTQESLVATLAERSGLDIERVENALVQRKAESTTFMRSIADLQQLNASL
jgi:hypothetical protein